jgi:tetrapyrrole methylase family protein / MazG family protein
MTVGERFERLVAIMHRLRAPGGCPWDGEQTHESIKPYLVEEAYEVLEAIDANDDRELCGELGDLMLQVVFHAEMASETDRFAIGDVIDAICDKLVRRHPHVFADTQVSGSEEVLRNWSKIKQQERRHSDDSSALAGVPRAMPALLRAHRIGEKASSAGFDWTRPEGVLDKLREELAELEQAVAAEGPERVEAELGDLLFAATSLARHLGVRSEDALGKATDRFESRFREMERRLAADGRELTALSEDKKEEAWQRAKSVPADG